MTERKGKHGGARPGAGRPKDAPILATMPPTTDALEFLLGVMVNDALDMRLRIDAAKAMMPFTHSKIGDTGKKENKATAAKKTARGKFAPSDPPVRLVR
jgi:phage terminase small subunit